MRPDAEKLHRRSIRLKAYDYAQPGAYFVTMVTAGRQCLFGQVVDQEMRLSRFGRIVEEQWLKTPSIRAEIELGTFVVMPNHFHAIVIISSDAPQSGASDVGATGRSPLRPRGPSPKSLGALIAGFKSSVTTRINELRHTHGAAVWQRNYHEHIVRDDKDWDRIHTYIESNPCTWAEDDENPACDS
jgi:REP-associated tyrosine transposase